MGSTYCNKSASAYKTKCQHQTVLYPVAYVACAEGPEVPVYKAGGWLYRLEGACLPQKRAELPE